MEDEEEVEVRLEVEAVQAVYGDDCCVIDEFPPHLTVHVVPRTAQDSSQQFVEAIIGIRTSAKYPKESAQVYLIETKGLDVSRQKHLIRCMHQKALELSYSGCLMIVALCEEAVEILSGMNHPEGDCPLCLYPLFPQNTNLTLHPFMKLMSCYHCFHSECIIGWWKWIHEQKNENGASDRETNSTGARSQRGLQPTQNEEEKSKGNCPVCRKEFDNKDIEHVLQYMGSNSITQLGEEANRIEEDEKELLQSKSEDERRKQFGDLLKLQQERDGIIEPKKDLVVQPGMYISLSLPTPMTSTATAEDSTENSLEPANEVAAPHNKQKNANVRKKNRRKHHHQRKQWVQKGAGHSTSTSDQ